MKNIASQTRLLKPSLLVLSILAMASLSACDTPAPPTDSSSSSASSGSSASDSASSESVASSEGSSSSDASSAPPSLPDFPHDPAMALIAHSGSSYNEPSNWAENICFPMADSPAYANSQVYHPGGTAVPSNTNQCDASNYAYPWQDNFCESRSWSNPLCNNGQGHQGQDIRPKTCKSNLYWAVAPEDGVVTQIGSYTVAITGNESPHRIFRYLHLQSSSLKVHVGDHVKRGQKLGLVSNNLGMSGGKQQYTTIHLHFEIRIAQSETLSNGTILSANAFVPPYTALVDAYRRKLNGDCPTL